MPDYKPKNDLAYDHLRGMIYSGELAFKTVYSETKLASELSVSRTPIRDALNRLAHERYIDILPNRGFMLHTPTQADIVEAYHVRRMIEEYCAQIVARRYPDARSRAAIDRMEDALERQHRLIEDGGAYSLSRFWLEDLTFHGAMVDYLDIPSMRRQYESYMHIFMPHHLVEGADVHRMQPRALERHRSTLTEHAAITEALKSRDAEHAREAVVAHADSSLRAMYTSLSEAAPQG